MKQAMITTIDNPYDPFTHYEDWNAYDVSMGYHTASYLARVAASTDELGMTIEKEATERAIDRIVEMNILGIYKKVYIND